MNDRNAGRGLGNQVNQGQAQQKATEEKQQKDVPGQGGQKGGTMNSPGDANESGSAGSTRRDDTTTPGNQR